MKYARFGLIFLGVILVLAGCSIFTETDLDETYFPFGLGYEWCYARHEFGQLEPGYAEDTTVT